MKLQKGDIVRYLNDVGGGIVSKILSNSMVEITDDSGFDIPVMEHDLVLIERPNKADASKIIQEEMSEIILEEIDGKDELHYVIAFTHVEKSVEQFYLYIINDCNYFANYVISFQKQGITEYVDSGIIEPNTKVCITELDFESISNIECVNLQCVAFKNKEFVLKKPIDIQYKIQHVKFYKPGVFVINDYFEEDAYVIDIFKENNQQNSNVNIKNELLQELHDKIIVDSKNNIVENKNQVIQETTKEVDLHIHELTENELGMDSAAKLELQISTFEKELHAALKSNYEKIVFIHGVGNGVLKAKIRGILDRDYKYLFYQDASFQKYKFGATLIYLKRMRK